MFNARIIPCLLLRGKGLVKTIRFKDPRYIGDPVNAARIFSEKEVDELILLDIDASCDNREPDYNLISEIAGECFMPLAYGGGITSLDQVRKLIRSGVEKVIINTAATKSYEIISEIASVYGSQAIVVAIDVSKSLWGGYKIMARSATLQTKLKLEDHINQVVRAGAGEIFINSVDRDGLMIGYDLEVIKKIVSLTSIPVVACGGAGNVDHLRQGIFEAGASAVSAGSMFVYHGKHKAVLINYPTGLFLNIQS